MRNVDLDPDGKDLRGCRRMRVISSKDVERALEDIFRREPICETTKTVNQFLQVEDKP